MTYISGRVHMRVAVVQTNPVFANVKSNLEEVCGYISREHADVFVLPELFNTGYNFIDAEEVAAFAETADGPTYQKMFSLAKDRASYICYGFAEKADRLYNSAILVGPEGLVGLYRKVHLFSREKLFFAPGDLGFPVFDLPFGKVGMMICFDWIFPESARSLALGGADLILHPSNLVLPHCPDAMITRCLENRVFAATANRVGTESRGGIVLSFIGKSEIISPRGEILHRLGDSQPGIGVADIDISLARNKQVTEFNHVMDDRRTAQYRLT